MNLTEDIKEYAKQYFHKIKKDTTDLQNAGVSSFFCDQLSRLTSEKIKIRVEDNLIHEQDKRLKEHLRKGKNLCDFGDIMGWVLRIRRKGNDRPVYFNSHTLSMNNISTTAIPQKVFGTRKRALSFAQQLIIHVHQPFLKRKHIQVITYKKALQESKITVNDFAEIS